MICAALATATSGAARAKAGLITWHWAGPVTGYTSAPVGLKLESVVPLGTPVDVFLTFDPDAPFLNPAQCLQGMGTTSMQVLGRTYTNQGYVWEDAQGFGPGVCAPGSNSVEVVVPSWGSSGPLLPDGWQVFNLDSLPGLWWGGSLADGQPLAISSQFPTFYKPQQSLRQRFIADLQAVPNVQPAPVPEPSSLLLLSTGLSAAAWWRRKRRQ